MSTLSFKPSSFEVTEIRNDSMRKKWDELNIPLSSNLHSTPRIRVHHNVYTAEQTITPKIARQYLSTQKINRDMGPHWANVANLYKAMKEGRFNNIGDTIRFNEYGELCDGQNRLIALILADYTIKNQTIVYGVAEADMTLIDVGDGRTGADAIDLISKAKGKELIASKSDLASCVTSLIRHCMGNGIDKTVRRNIIPDHVGEFFVKFPEVQGSVNLTKSCRLVGKKGLFAAMHFIYTKQGHGEKANEFFYALGTGIGLSARSPILAARNKLQDRKQNKNETMTDHFQSYVTNEAFKKFLKGSKSTVIKYYPDGVVDLYVPDLSKALKAS